MRYPSPPGQQLGYREVWQEPNQAPLTKSGEIAEHVREKPLEKLSIQVTLYLWVSAKRLYSSYTLDRGHMEGFSLEAALDCSGHHKRTLSNQERKYMYSAFMAEAESLADQLASEGLPAEHSLEPELEVLKFFSIPERSVVNQ